MSRRQNFQTISWFYDLYNRQLLNLDPPYQRRSVWNQEYKDFFIDTILLNYPSPAIFLFEDINPDGKATYNVVDGKQRLSTVFEFVTNVFPISDTASLTDVRGKYFDEISKDLKIQIWNYSFLVEYLPTSDESIINSIFDRINRNVAKLTSQELRHARLSGHFIATAEDLAEFMIDSLATFPRIASQSKKQMKDVELVSQLMLLIEEGPKGYSSDELDKAFSDRDTTWDSKERISSLFKDTILCIKNILKLDTENILIRSRFTNQADFYSLFGAICYELMNDKAKSSEYYLEKFKQFLTIVENEEKRQSTPLETYYQHARAASNRTTARRERIDILNDYLNDKISV